MSKVLLVDDEEEVRESLGQALERQGLQVTVAATVTEAMRQIQEEHFDVLLSDLHMPGAVEALSLVSAMRQVNPQAVTLLLSGLEAGLDRAADMVMMQADEMVVKPMNVHGLIRLVRERLAAPPAARTVIDTVATVLERETHSTIEQWYTRVQSEDKVIAVPMSKQERCSYLPQLFGEVVDRLRSPTPVGANAPRRSPAAVLHGRTRRQQGYSAAMMVEESRMLQVSIFQTLQDNLTRMDQGVLLIGVMTIADEVDAQLSSAMESYKVEASTDALPA